VASALEPVSNNPANPSGTAIGALFHFMLPDPDHPPAHQSEFSTHPAVAGDVVVDFIVPVLSIGRRSSAVLRAAVPETAINENGDSRLDKDDVGLSREFLAEAVSQAPLVQGASQGEFARRVLAFDTAHRFRAL